MNHSGQLDIFHSHPVEESSRNFVIYRSSAGSGKTFTLVKEYLKIVLRNPDDYQHILAVTFTNKATDEMKSRIVGYLARLAGGEDFDMRREIEKDFEGNKKDNLLIEKRARTALDNILHNYSRFEVSTIDHFFAQLVRVLARELKLPARFDIDVDNEKAIKEALELLYTHLNTDQELLVWMEQFALNKLESDKGWKIDYNIRELGMELFKEKFHEGFSDQEIVIDDLRDFVAELNKTRRGFIHTMREHAERGNKFLQNHNLTSADFKSNTASYFDRVLNGNYSITKTFEAVARGNDRWYTQKALNKDQIDHLVGQGLQQIAADLQEYHSAMYRSYVSSIELLKNIYSYGLLGLLYKQLRRYRNENSLMLLSDTNFILRNVIQDKDTPFLFEKLGGRFNHILIDEFQDTSNYQWKNILPLVFNSISNNFRGVVVGDIKQSIYRWRGGNFNLLLNGVQEDLDQYRGQIEVKGLKQNWRSSRSVVLFNNAFFGMAQAILQSNPEIPLGSTIIGDAYQDLVQSPMREKEGYVEVKFFETDSNDSKPSNVSTEAQKYTLDVIERVVNLGYSYGEIMILVDRWDLAAEISQHLNQVHIPLVTENSLLLENSDLIRFLLSTMTWLVNPVDRTAHANMLYLFTVLHQEHMEDYHPLFGGNSAFASSALPPEFIENLKKIRVKPVYDLVEELIIVFDLSGQADIYLQRFQDVCLEQTARGNQNVADFLIWWEDAKGRKDKKRELSVVLPPHTDAVQIKTVHQAKGLEAPIVIIPFANFDLKPLPRTTFWTDKLATQFQEFKVLPLEFTSQLLQSHFVEAYREELVEELLERLNVAYVAFTRARDQLYLMANRFNSDHYKLEDTALNKVIFGVLDNPGFEFHQNWDRNQWTWNLGSPQPKDTQKEAAPSLSEELKLFSSSNYSQKVTIRPESKKFFMLFDQEKSGKIKEGIMIHAVLERLEREDELEKALKECLNIGVIGLDEMAKIEESVKTLFENPTFKDWFGPGWKVLNERSIIHEGKIYRPDRVMLKDKEAVIVDYKREKRESEHESQLNQYGQLLNKMGIESVKKYAVYVSDFTIVEVA